MHKTAKYKQNVERTVPLSGTTLLVASLVDAVDRGVLDAPAVSAPQVRDVGERDSFHNAVER